MTKTIQIPAQFLCLFVKAASIKLWGQGFCVCQLSILNANGCGMSETYYKLVSFVSPSCVCSPLLQCSIPGSQTDSPKTS